MPDELLIVTDTTRPLAEVLASCGVAPELRCGGSGRCGRCRVRVQSGVWRVNDALIEAPAELPACRAILVSASGSVIRPKTPCQVETDLKWRDGDIPFTEKEVIAVDLGTTTVAAAKIKAGIVTAVSGCANLQQRFGDNVIDRIGAFAGHGKELRQAALASIAQAVAALHPAPETHAVIAANSVMSCLLHGIDPTPIGRYPFQLPVREFPALAGDLIGLSGSSAETIPPLAPYLGGDVAAGLLAFPLNPKEMLVDLGTNCEIVYCDARGRLIGSSAAAGPAFEGAGLRCGSRAQTGALGRWLAPGRGLVIGGGAAQSVCGTAWIDFLAGMRKAGTLDRCGNILAGQTELEIMPGLTISQTEIALLLTAKAAVYAGITQLEQACGERAETIFLAGGLSAHLNIRNAVAIGMLPAGREYRAIGNSALAGALAYGAKKAALPKVTEVPLNTLPGFDRAFADAMPLP